MHATGTITCREVSKAYGAKLLLSDVSLTVAPGARIGLVGPNGTGKSTLLRMLARLEPPDSGEVVWSPRSLAVGYLPQEPDADPAETVLAYLARRTGVVAAEAEVDRLAAAMGASSKTADAYSEALDRFVLLGGGDLEARAASVCADLGLTDHVHRSMGSLSGGQRARAALGAVLLARFGVFLLDEPTNDLDLDGLERLESHVERLAGGVVVVSHDRAFLERVVHDVFEIQEGTASTRLYSGGWDAYLHAREVDRAHGYRAHERTTAQRRELTERARRIRAWAEQGASKQRRQPSDNDKMQRDFALNRTEKQASRVRRIEKQLDRLEVAPKPFEPWELRLNLEPSKRAGDVVARLTDAVVTLGTFRLGPVSLEIGWGERVAILGRNGSGKTTLLRALLGELSLDSGERYVGPGAVLGVIGQDRAAYATPEPLLDVFCRDTGLQPGEARTLLAKFRLGAEEVGRPSASLSPGERTRAGLGALAAKGVNCLVLDEPTNHLDLPAIEELETALGAFEGTLIVVTHDRRFLEALQIERRIELG